MSTSYKYDTKTNTNSSNRSERLRPNKVVVVLSTIGAILIGISAIQFVSANWYKMTDIVKMALLSSATLTVYIAGYWFRYIRNIAPRFGSSLIFLSLLLFGATLLLASQIYNTNANSHWLMLLWITGLVIPLYLFRSKSIAALGEVLFFIWLGLFLFRNNRFSEVIIRSLPAIYCIISLLFMGIAQLHTLLFKGMASIGSIWRVFTIQIATISLLLLTFPFFAGTEYIHEDIKTRITLHGLPDNLQSSLIVCVIAGSIALAIPLIQYCFRKNLTRDYRILNIVALVLLLFTFVFFTTPIYSNLYTVIFNVIFVSIMIFKILIGYRERNRLIFISGAIWLSIFLIIKYTDSFWNSLSRSLFFLIGGAFLLIGSIIIERKSRAIKESWKVTGAKQDTISDNTISTSDSADSSHNTDSSNDIASIELNEPQ